MSTANMATYAYDQIDQARAELDAVSKRPGQLSADSWRRLGPRDMAFEAQRCRHRAVAVPIIAVASLVTAGLGEQRSQPQQGDVAY